MTVQKNEYEIEEYKIIRDEVMYMLKMINLFYYAYIVFICTFIPKVIENFDQIMSIIFLFISCTFILCMRSYNHRIARAATYLKVHLEPKLPGIDWETNLYKLIETTRNNRNSMQKIKDFIWHYSIHIFSLFFILAIFLYQKEISCYFALIYIVFVAFIVSEMKDSSIDSIRKEYIDIWKCSLK